MSEEESFWCTPEMEKRCKHSYVDCDHCQRNEKLEEPRDCFEEKEAVE